MTAAYRGVLFDLGGVVLEGHTEGFRVYERSLGLAPGAIARLIHEIGEDGAWASLERGEIDVATFRPAFEDEARAAGIVLDAGRVLAALSSQPRRPMLEALRVLRLRGVKVGAITNGFRPLAGGGLRAAFDIVVESVVEGVRKPDPAIYIRALERIGCPAPTVVYLDDLGVNLKPARALGMATIKVADPAVALADLETLIGFGLREAA